MLKDPQRECSSSCLIGAELTALDLGLVLERLAQVDPEVTGLRTGSLDGQR